jgi:hypothetical protein
MAFYVSVRGEELEIIVIKNKQIFSSTVAMNFAL